MNSYLDHAATSPMRPEAKEALLREASRVGNASSLHRAGQQARRRLEEAREELAAALGASPPEVIFTSGGSEADSIAILGSLAARPERVGALVSAVEHPAVLEARGHGAGVLPVGPDGVVLEPAWDSADENVAVISVMTVNNETGVIQPLDRLVSTCSRTGAWSHSDAVQAFGHIPLEFQSLGLDLMSVSAHKIGGPVGVGALVVRRGITPCPIGLGGGQEGRIRSGTLPVALAASFAAAATKAVAELAAESAQLTSLRDDIRGLALASGGRVNGKDCAPQCHLPRTAGPGPPVPAGRQRHLRLRGLRLPRWCAPSQRGAARHGGPGGRGRSYGAVLARSLEHPGGCRPASPGAAGSRGTSPRSRIEFCGHSCGKEGGSGSYVRGGRLCGRSRASRGRGT